ncbi:hypothetical protein EAI_03794 [Harpegnathos saltator]|uniref:Platelet-derived growth factor (PDGF) family profile domain-containing protein n=1 Tax=Harpegnathos saltator TaxID=610380 RepID=E2BT83_HARSA|nr:hypothetical protein EAI_03794 [Harpegnathos saltator]
MKCVHEQLLDRSPPLKHTSCCFAQGYTDDDNSERDKAAAVDASATISSSSSSTITTRATSTTPKWPANGDGKNQAKANERGTAAQYSGYQPKNDYPPMSAHSDYKWRTLGTRESVTQTRSNMLQYIKNGVYNKGHPAYREALRYSEKVKDEASCRWPRAKVIRVSDVRPDPSVNYHPHCAILHECSDNTGCCKSDELTCVANKSHTVQLTFYAFGRSDNPHNSQLATRSGHKNRNAAPKFGQACALSARIILRANTPTFLELFASAQQNARRKSGHTVR